MPRLLGTFAKGVIIFGLLWAARWALIRWIDGPPEDLSSPEWNGGAAAGTTAGEAAAGTTTGGAATGGAAAGNLE